MPKRIRDYKAEYRRYHSKPKQKKRRAGRNAARDKMVKKHGKTALRGKDVDHKNRNARDNRLSNLRISSRKKNRGRNK